MSTLSELMVCVSRGSVSCLGHRGSEIMLKSGDIMAYTTPKSSYLGLCTIISPLFSLTKEIFGDA